MDKIFIEKIQKMSEKDFTQKIIMLIFEYMGYEKIIYHGGVNEYGRDIIMWGEDKLGNKEVAVAQVKMDKLNSNSSSNLSIKVYDILGRKIESKAISVLELEKTNIGQNYPNGVYNIIIQQDENIKILKMIKK